MVNVITLPDGRNETIFNERDFMELLDKYMGFEARRWLEEWLRENSDTDCIEALEKEMDKLIEHHKETMEELRNQSETIASLVREKDIDRKALSAAAGTIGCITWKEANG